MPTTLEILNKRLKRAKSSKKLAILNGAYKQLVVSRKGNQANGEFRQLAKSDHNKAYELVDFLSEKLENAGLQKHVARLRNQYKSTFDYERLSDGSIRIDVKGSPQEVFEAIAQASYEASRPVGMGFLQPYNTQSDKIDFGQLIDLEGRSGRVLAMDYVNGRQCKTYIKRNGDGSYIFDAWLFERDRGNPGIVLKTAKDLLAGKSSPKVDSLDSIVDYEEEYQQPSHAYTLPMNIAREKLKNIGKIDPDMDVMVQDFARLLADYLVNEELRPEGVVMSIQYLKYDLEKGFYGIGNLRGRPIQSSLVGQPSMVYSLMEMNLLRSMDKIFPQWFTKGINDFYKDAMEASRKKAE